LKREVIGDHLWNKVSYLINKKPQRYKINNFNIILTIKNIFLFYYFKNILYIRGQYDIFYKL